MISGIYKIHNLKSGKIYIGSSRNIKSRLSDHKSALRNNRHGNIFLQRAFNRDGEENFVFEKLRSCAVDDLVRFEQRYLDIYQSYLPENGYNICRIAESVATHGMTNSVEYGAWCKMLSRCNNPDDPNYKTVGGAGIKVCAEWLDSFEQFFKDMGLRPKGLIFCRKDMGGDYTPDNCDWASSKIRSLRHPTTVKVEIAGEVLSQVEASEKMGIHKNTITKRMNKFGETREQALRHFIDRGYKRVVLNGETMRCADAEKKLGLYKGAINCRRSRNGETLQQALDYLSRDHHRKGSIFVTVNGQKMLCSEAERFLGLYRSALTHEVKRRGITHQQAADHFYLRHVDRQLTFVKTLRDTVQQTLQQIAA